MAVIAVLLSLAVFVAAVPFLDRPLPRVPAFIGCYESALIICDLVTAVLLFGQFATGNAVGLLFLAGGYLFSALMTIPHALTFPGLFSAAGLFGAGPQTTAWLYMFWHGGFPVAILAYVALKERYSDRAGVGVVGAIGFTVLIVVCLVAALAVVAIADRGGLPAIMRGDGYTASMTVVVTSVWMLNVVALAALLMRRPYSVLDAWLFVVLCVWLCDIAMSAVYNAGRFDLGFYLGRAYGLVASSFLLIALLFETAGLYGRLARSLAAENRERGDKLREMQSELIHVTRLGEVGQMVLALAHEVNQPLSAIGNYVRGSQRLIRSGEPDKAVGALEKAADEAVRAGEIIRRLRNFIGKQEGQRQVEDLDATIREIVPFALTGVDRSVVAVTMSVHPAAASAVIDRIQIQQVFLNLIRNAIEAMAGQSHQTLVIATSPTADGMVELSVADDGPGLPAAVRERLFQPFVTTKSGGMGVGLSICRSIVERHGGRLWTEDAEGGGTVFRFTVPALDSRNEKGQREKRASDRTGEENAEEV